MGKIKLLQFLKRILPSHLKTSLRNLIPIPDYDQHILNKSNPYFNDDDEVLFEDSPIQVGIVFGRMQYHKYWIAACRDLKISYKIIYLEKNDWINQIVDSKIEYLLVWPDISSIEIKNMVDERLRIIHEELNVRIFPSVKEIWLYENKRVQNYWLKINKFKIPDTSVFYNVEDANDFLSKTKFPVVLKSNLGASASGVYILKNKEVAKKITTNFLTKGYKLKRKGANKRQKGNIYIQEYLPNVKEWRMVRIGNSYFGHGKDLNGDFHSGSGKANWDMPPLKAFELLKEITDKGNFRSMDVDIFEDQNGELYVNELQTVFGNSIAKEQMKIDGKPGRYIYTNGKWVFEEGSFCENHLCNLRLEELLCLKNRK